MRARYPDLEGFAEAKDLKIYYEVFGEGIPNILFLNGWQLAHSRMWKLQVPYFSRANRVVVFDYPGNGKSDRPTRIDQVRPVAWAEYALAVIKAAGLESVVLVSESAGSIPALILAATQPDLIRGVVFQGPAYYGPPTPIQEAFATFEDEPKDTSQWWQHVNYHLWKRDLRGSIEAIAKGTTPEPHSIRGIEELVEWALESDVETLALATRGLGAGLPREKALGKKVEESLRSLAAQVMCPVLVVQGTEDWMTPMEYAENLARDTNGTLTVFEGSGHGPGFREPVRFNLLLRDFVSSIEPKKPKAFRYKRPLLRRRRLLYVSSSIGLGHARRDLAVAKELRNIDPSLSVEWFTQHPVTVLLQREEETVHPASALLANESAYIESEASGHNLHVFQAFRRADEILLANFMVFSDLIEQEHFDGWIVDEGWDIDYFLHENPELKRAPFVWFTDFVGMLPMPEGGENEKYLARDFNEEMVELLDRYRYVRDLSLFVGNPDDIVPDRLGEGLPLIREWTERHFRFPGYITGFDPIEEDQRTEVRRELGFSQGEAICIVAVGGSGVGESLIRKILGAYPEAKRSIPELRMIVVTGPRISSTFEAPEGVEVLRYVHGLYRHLAACDIAVVQGGLTTSMELTANRRPFIYVPLKNHFEQQFHVAHRLDRYGAGRRMEFDEIEPTALASALTQELSKTPDCLPVERDGAKNAADMIAEQLGIG